MMAIMRRARIVLMISFTNFFAGKANAFRQNNSILHLDLWRRYPPLTFQSAAGRETALFRSFTQGTDISAWSGLTPRVQYRPCAWQAPSRTPDNRVIDLRFIVVVGHSGCTSVQTLPRRTRLCGSEPEYRPWLDRSATPPDQYQESSSGAGTPRHSGRWPAGGGADAELFAKRPSDNEQRFNQRRQVGKVLDKLLDPRFELHLPDYSDVETEVAQRAAQVVLDSDRLRLQQLAVGQQHPQFLTA
jgi:hypothetical protein